MLQIKFNKSVVQFSACFFGIIGIKLNFFKFLQFSTNINLLAYSRANIVRAREIRAGVMENYVTSDLDSELQFKLYTISHLSLGFVNFKHVLSATPVQFSNEVQLQFQLYLFNKPLGLSVSIKFDTESLKHVIILIIDLN